MNLLELRLPSLTGSDPETQLLQLRSYLYQLTEQLQLALGTREETAVTPDTQKLLREAEEKSQGGPANVPLDFSAQAKEPEARWPFKR